MTERIVLHLIGLAEVVGVKLARELWDTHFLAFAGEKLVEVGIWPPAKLDENVTDMWVPSSVLTAARRLADQGS